jgi:LmbE family N-acetylglucosaminyl deacetylase
LGLPHRGRFARITRLFIIGIGLPCIYLGGASAAFFYHHRAVNLAALTPSVRVPEPVSTTRLLVFAPHCDDETLGCAGLMQRTLAAGGKVRAVMITNGDGFRTAVERQSRSLRVGASDYIQFAALRQKESERALGRQGLKPSDIDFMGYPDRGLMPLWSSYWSPSQPFFSAYTRCTRSPYPRTFDPKAEYCGHDLVEDIKTEMRQFHPTMVTVTHPSDDHPDHSAAAAFVTLALQELRNSPADASWAAHTELRYYLIHRGDWPVPQGSHDDLPLTPPAEMSKLDTEWMDLPLTKNEEQRKAESVDLYPSQTALMRRFLISFARKNEILGTLNTPTLPVMPNGSIAIDGTLKGWSGIRPAMLDAVGDNLLRDLQGSGDIEAIYACRDDQNLYLRADMRHPISGRIGYTFRLRAFTADGSTSQKVVTVRVHPGSVSETDGIRSAGNERTVEAAVPLSAIISDPGALRYIAVNAQTTVAGVEIDRTGIAILASGQAQPAGP